MLKLYSKLEAGAGTSVQDWCELFSQLKNYIQSEDLSIQSQPM